MPDNFTLEIANIPVRITCDDWALVDALCKRYEPFLSDRGAQANLEANVTRTQAPPTLFQVQPNFLPTGFALVGENYYGSFDLDQAQGTISISSILPQEDLEYFLRLVYSFLVFQSSGILFHSAAIARDEKAYLFFGHSGSGKTTVSRLSSTYTILNDDLVVIQPEVTHWQVYPTPFWNPTQVKPCSQSAPLAMILRLVQDKQVFLEPITPAQAIADMLASVPVINADNKRSAALLDRCRRLLNDVPAYRLHFLPDTSFWKAIEEVV